MFFDFVVERLSFWLLGHYWLTLQQRLLWWLSSESAVANCRDVDGNETGFVSPWFVYTLEGSRTLLCCFSYLYLKHASYLVDPASSHMLVSRIKPCMSKFKRFILWDCGRLIISVIVYLMVTTTRITVVILELILALKALLCLHLLDFPPICFAVRWIIVTKRIKSSDLTLHSSFCPISFRR